MSRGVGSVQRRVLDALIERRDNDCYGTETLYDLFGPTDFDVVRARWRWYTVDLLDLVQFGAPRSERVSLHRAVRALHDRGRIDIATSCPYEQPFGAHLNEYGQRVGGVDLSELSSIDWRWPSGPGRCLWFRLKMPRRFFGYGDYAPLDDASFLLADLGDYQADAYEEFAGALDRREAWDSDIGRFLRWCFCGSPPPTGAAAR